MSLPALPLFHRIAGQPVIVLGHGEAAQAKARLVERAGGQVIDDLAHGIDIGARLAFIAHDSADACMADALRARGAGLLVNVVDRPALCDFTTPSLVDRSPVVIAVGTAGASAGLAKHIRLRLERLLPQGLGALADALFAAREGLRARFPDGAERRRALDLALGEGGALDPMVAQPAGAVEAWLGGARGGATGHHVIALRSADPEDLTLREARLLGMADAVVAASDVPAALLARARADAQRLPPGAALPEGLTVELRLPG
ncbi:bifunctional precorrin-2 dehydrogenase/sirohydrochlorin ferrochelatase [Novosphingobium sp. SG720]|uniref:precorrin-2 dehydrogenase/sirohydrochlorin ferrochelatase family protein n=1 Tax=Novosphingobium sp. SG720 TaxID=2586998 RepID=UPI0014457CF8|nr:bifunctional precorrin-2 dehydrogenase/sirohydrochlorin ferrochelatase [Novosphingobium sp. SG720]NKJ42983.1 uroporphyrin-III C-methyltransferase/precorrin-2 dehydrogenase/sirohydrochlorin ferrochelatase [Novosphingobium sp. SG720]